LFGLPLALLVCLALGPQAIAAGWTPQSFVASYGLETMGFNIGTMDRELTVNASGIYAYRSEMRAEGIAKMFLKGKVTERSTGVCQGEQCVPSLYVADNPGSKKVKHTEIRFDWGGGQVQVRLDSQALLHPLQTDMIDKLTVELILMRDIAKGQRETAYTVVEGRKVKTYRMKVLGNERVNSPQGSFDAVKLIRDMSEARQTGNPRNTVIWSVPALDFIPVRVEHTEKDGRVITAVLKSLRRGGASVADAR
jgi:hypothetical protein